MLEHRKPFRIETTPYAEDPGIAYVQLSGFLDAHTVSDFDREMDARIGDGSCRFIVDMTELKYTSSAGIGAFMRLAQQLGAREGDLVLMNPTDHVLEIFELLDFTRIFKMARTSQEAVALLQEE